jgi:hypothetical protein
MKNGIIPTNVKAEFEANLKTSGGTPAKLEGARRMVSSRLIMKFGMKWWNQNQAEILDEMGSIERSILQEEKK